MIILQTKVEVRKNGVLITKAEGTRAQRPLTVHRVGSCCGSHTAQAYSNLAKVSR